MTTAKAHVETVNENELLVIVRGMNGDYHELRGLSWNHIMRRLDEFCKLNEIALVEMPHRERVS